jgi:hypothetical protein
VTSMALIAGLEAANAGRASVISALFIAAVADNLTDSLSVHMYQESERFERKDAFVGTLTNFATRLVVCLSFVIIVVSIPSRMPWLQEWPGVYRCSQFLHDDYPPGMKHS